MKLHNIFFIFALLLAADRPSEASWVTGRDFAIKIKAKVCSEKLDLYENESDKAILNTPDIFTFKGLVPVMIEIINGLDTAIQIVNQSYIINGKNNASFISYYDSLLPLTDAKRKLTENLMLPEQIVIERGRTVKKLVFIGTEKKLLLNVIDLSTNQVIREFKYECITAKNKLILDVHGLGTITIL